MLNKTIATLIAEARVKYPSAQRDWLVREVVDNMKPEDYKEYLVAAVGTFYIPQALNSERHQAQRDLRPSVTNPTTIIKQAHVTSKKAKITQETRWERYLGSRMNIDGVFREVRSLTATDLRIMADKNKAKAAQNAANAVLHEKLATLVTTSNVSTLGEVSEAQAEAAGVLEADLV